MTGPVRNWQFVPPNWILPLDDFLANPKLTDAAWFKLDDFYAPLIAANRWNGKTGGGVGEGPLYSLPVLEESYILAYRKDIFDQYNIKVPTTLEEMAEAARLVKKNAGIPGIVRLRFHGPGSDPVQAGPGGPTLFARFVREYFTNYGYVQTFHLVGNVRVRFTGEDTAQVRSYINATHWMADGRILRTPIEYDDAVVRGRDGLAGRRAPRPAG